MSGFCQTNPSPVERRFQISDSDAGARHLCVSAPLRFSKNYETKPSVDPVSGATDETRNFTDKEGKVKGRKVSRFYQTNPSCQESQISGFEISDSGERGSQTAATAFYQ